jgi:hypothetical protein
MKDIVEQLRAPDGNRRLLDEAADRIEKLEAENNRLLERLGPRGLEVVFIGDTGHYVNVKIKAHIEKLEAALREAVRIAYDFDCHLAGYPNGEAQSFYEGGVADASKMISERIAALVPNTDAGCGKSVIEPWRQENNDVFPGFRGNNDHA